MRTLHFEISLGTLFRRLGYVVEITRYRGDYGADLVVAATLADARGVGQGSGYFKKLRPRFCRPLVHW